MSNDFNMGNKLSRTAYAAVQWIYNNSIRERLPSKLSVSQGVVMKNQRLFDRHDHNPDYEKPTMDAIQNHVQKDDDVYCGDACRRRHKRGEYL